jgi:diaminopimelate epimerase
MRQQRPLHMVEIAFAKLHGAGNDFVLIEAFSLPADIDYADLAQALGNRRTGVGFDQLMLVMKSPGAASGFGYQIFNSDGSRAQQCGNGARAVAWWLIHRHGLSTPFELASPAGIVKVSQTAEGQIGVSLGKPEFNPITIPMLGHTPALRYQTQVTGQFIEFSCLSLGNPHATILVPSVANAEVEHIGAALQSHSDFPERVNVGFCEQISRNYAKLRVYERGAGETLACGSGACAAAINLIRLGFAERSVTLALPGGELNVNWPSDDAEVVLCGPVVHVFDGRLTH